MAARKRNTKKKPAPKPPTSNIAAAQRAAVQRRTERVEKEREVGQKASAPTPPKIDPRTGLPIPEPTGKNIPGDPVGRGTNLAAQGKSDGDKKPPGAAKGLSEAANTVAGLASGIMEARQTETKRALASTSLYGVSDKVIKDRMVAQTNAVLQTKNKKLKDSGGAVFLGTKAQQIRRAQQGGEFEGGTNRIPQSIDVDDVRSKDELMSWLADEKMFNEIRAKAQKAGMAVESYDDVAKLWTSIVNQAAATYSSVGKKVTPWDLMSLRGKTMKGGKPASKTTTSTTIDEMDSAEAKLMIKNAAANALGRDPTSDEIEDFISKAQTIASANPNITTTTTQYGFDGEATSQSSISKGGGDAVTAQAQLAAEEQAKESEDYTSYQAAGVMMPWLNEALASPF